MTFFNEVIIVAVFTGYGYVESVIARIAVKLDVINVIVQILVIALLQFDYELMLFIEIFYGFRDVYGAMIVLFAFDAGNMLFSSTYFTFLDLSAVIFGFYKRPITFAVFVKINNGFTEPTG